MTQTFKSKMWRICAHCLGTIAPHHRAAYLSEEIACMGCLSADERIAADELAAETQEMQRPHVTAIPADMFDELMKDEN